MGKASMKWSYTIAPDDFQAAGEASSDVKRKLKQLGVPQSVLKRVSIAVYEGEMNVVIHGRGGTLVVMVDQKTITMVFEDQGPGIKDVGLAMKEGYSTAPDYVREMGFGAGMGLPNIDRNADRMRIENRPKAGTKLTIEVDMQ